MKMTFAAVAIVMVLLIGMVVLILRSLAVSAGVKIRKDMLGVLGSYDRLIEEKSAELRELREELEALETQSAVAATAAAAEPEEPAEPEIVYGAATVPSAVSYRTSAFGSGYGAIRETFRLSAEDEQYLIDHVLDETDDLQQGRGARAAELRGRLSFDTMFSLSQLTGDEQLELLDTSLADEDWTLLRDYWETHGNEPFDVTKFCDWLDTLTALETDTVVVRGEDAAGSRICEGIQVIAGSRLYDYSIKEGEIN